jgi:DNA-binding beta-propeller fold protein YncE
VGRYDLAAVVQALKAAGSQRVAGPGGRSLSVGMGVRTIELSPDQRSLYAAINNDSKLVKIDLSSWSVVARSDVDPFTVGLAVSPDGKTIVTTSQGREMVGGHSVGLYRDATR